MFHKVFRGVAIATLLFFSHSLVAKKATKKAPKKITQAAPIVIDNRYQDIEKYCTSMLAKKELEKLQAAKEKPGMVASFLNSVTGIFHKTPYSLPALDRSDLVFTSLGKLKTFNRDADPIERTTVINPDVWINLELFTNQSKIAEKTVIGAIKRTRTTVGELTLTRMILDPLTDIEKIMARQEFIRTLVENDDLYEQLTNIVDQVAQEENSLVSLLLASDSFRQDAILNSYDTIGALKSPTAIATSLNTANLLKNFLPAIALTFYAGLFDGLGIWLAKDFDGAIISSTVKTQKAAAEANRQPFDPIAARAQAAAQLQAVKDRDPQGFQVLRRAIVVTLGVIGGTLTTFLFKKLGAIKKDAQTAVYIQRRLSSVSVLLEALRRITKLHSALAVGELAAHAEKYHHDYEPKLKELRNRLDKSKFVPRKDGAIPGTLQYIFSNQGDIANGLLEAKKTLPIMIDGLTLIGHIDAYLSMARLVRERKHSRAPYCFAEFMGGEETPVIYAENFFHPSVQLDRAVTNSVTIGDNGSPRSVVISGVNAGGKSTLMKSITLCCIMGQVFGVVPAGRFIFTPFHSINTYLNITDDVSKQQSLFRAELARAQSLLTLVKELPAHQFSLTILDEICTGTERIEGEALAYAVAKKLGMYANSMTILASHFPGLSQLARDASDLYKNMKVIVEKDEYGDFVYPYGLYEGATTQQIAPDLLEKTGLPRIMTEKMRDVLNNPNNYLNTKD